MFQDRPGEQLWIGRSTVELGKEAGSEIARGLILLFEAVLFLKDNSTYWNEYEVKEAMEKLKSGKVQKRLKEDNQHQ